MRNIFTYEYKKIKQVSPYLPLMIVLTEIIFLLFFSIVIWLDGESTSVGDLTDVEFIITLVTTITFCVVVVYATYFMNKFLVSNYIGHAKEKTYSFPSGRTHMLTQKMSAFCYRMLATFVPLALLVSIVFIIFSQIVSLFNEVELLPVMLHLSMFMLIVSMLIITVVLLSIIAGLHYQSTNISLITTVILVTILSNFVARSPMNIIFQIIIVGLLVVINMMIFKYIQNKVKIDDVI
jgi:cytochrome bd-type quinol oxidase subunit 2